MSQLPRVTRDLLARYPRQFWLMMGGELVSIIGRSMVFPFLILYLHGQLGLPLTTAGALLALFSLVGAAGQGIGGTLADRLGRKGVMAFSLLAGALATLALGFVSALASIAALLLLYGLLGSLYEPAATAMIADLTTEEDRAEAYSLWRVAMNAGVAIGPAVGGFLASRSYVYAFGGNTVGCLLYMLLVALAMHETRPAALAGHGGPAQGSYLHILRNGPFVAFLILFPLSYLVYSFVMLVMPVYMKDYHGLGEQYFGLLMSANAAIVVLLQFPMTRLLRGANHLALVAAGALVSALAVTTVAWSSRFWHFLVVMIVLTLGENLFMPTATTVAADLAPPELRGRYMGAMGVTWFIGWGGAPVVAGLLAGWLGPQGPWLAGGAAGALFALGLYALSRVPLSRPAAE